MHFDDLLKILSPFSLNRAVTAHAHKEIAPYRELNYPESTVVRAKKASVLLHLHEHNEESHFTLIMRPEYDGVHSKQIAFPGGKAEREDQNALITALREAKEEVNIDIDQYNVLGPLSPIYIPPSDFYLSPFLSFSKNRPDYLADEREVDEIIEVPIRELLRMHILKDTKLKLKNNVSLQTPYLDIQDKIVWGATALILNEFRHLILHRIGQKI